MQDGISAVVPVYNSEECLPALVERLHRVLSEASPEFEIILVNDGSRDRSWSVVEQLAAQWPRVTGVDLLRNFGQHNALLAGVRQARFSVIVTLDDDLQNPPEEIPKLLRKLDENADVVYGVPLRRGHNPFRNVTSRVTKALLARAMKIDSIVDISPFRAFRTSLRAAFDNYESPDLLLDVLLSWGTSRFAAVPVEHRPRTLGRSNYTLGKLLNHTLLIVTGFRTEALRIASAVGFVFTLFGLAILAWVVVRYFISGDPVPGFPFLASVIALFSGAQLFALGIIGEYLARIFNRTMARPVYVIRKTTTGQDSGSP